MANMRDKNKRLKGFGIPVEVCVKYERLAGVKAVGPVLQGLNKPVNDLSRGTTADEIVLNIAITVLQALSEN